ncbi:zinc finger protein 280D isoform X2 [Hyperolius riggenbachi]|uniref:zinc finger protein 280D isoform X2 n=1 Tax=Hyperolius riggenbachi TaxID=752182 RepID=UPI0035A2F4CB
MAELLMECEEEDLEPWQQRDVDVNVDDEDDDDEPIFVREISCPKTTSTSSSKTTTTSSTSGSQPSSFGRVENGTPARGPSAPFQPPSNHYKPTTPPHKAASVTQPVAPMYRPMTRPPISSAIVQPLPRPARMPEPVRRPIVGLPMQQPPRPTTAMQPICRPVPFTPNTPPVCRNITFPTMSQPPLRPVATIPAQPVMLNQGYIMTSPQMPSNSHNVMYALRPSTTVPQYQGVQTLTATGNSTSLIRPLQPLHQIRPVSTPARTTPTYIHRPPPPSPSMQQNNLNLVPVLHQPLLQNSQKTQQTILTQSSSANIGRNENVPMEKRSATIDLTDDSPKRQKTNENIVESRPHGASTASRPVSVPGRQQATPLQNMPAKVNAGPGPGTGTASSPTKNGTPFPRACPKCNIHFNLLEPMKKHMTYCCPEKMQHFFPGIANAEASKPQITIEDNDKGKLIMLVSEFYYGKHPGDPILVQQEQKTNTTFKCFSCQKLLKNNIRFMNHMKHHLELEKQSTESWENHTTCHHCYRQFPTPFQLQCHIESSHTLYESTTICKICELSFDSEQILLQHMKDNHKPGEMPYVCQNKGVYRCGKCRLQFLTCKEKMDHKAQHHRTFRKPKQLEGLPPGTKVTIRASTLVAASPLPSPTSPVHQNPPVTPPKPPPQLVPASPPKPAPPKIKVVSPKNTQVSPPKVNPVPPKPKSPPKKPATPNTTRRMKTTNTVLQSIRYIPGFHKCIECHRQVVDFEGHFHTYIHCSKCKFSTSCNKAYTSHMQSFHGRNSSKRSKGSKKTPKDKRRVTVVCLNCDFLTDVAGLDDMAKHLSESHTHSCQVVTENVSIFSSTHEGDMSKARLQLPVKQAKISHKDENSDTENHAATDESMENKLTPETQEHENDACGDSSPSQGQKSTLSPSKQTTVEQGEATIEKTESSSPIPEDTTQVMESASKIENVLTEDKSCSDSASEMDEPSDNEEVVTGDFEEVSSPMEAEDHQELNPANDNIGFEQFLRKDVADSVSSDVSEPNSLQLDPLTPSEVLEHETTEILQKGSVGGSSQTGTSGEKTEEVPDTSEDVSVPVESEGENDNVL